MKQSLGVVLATAARKSVLAGLLMFPLAGCSGGGDSGPITPTPPSGPNKAAITVACSPYTVSSSLRRGFNFRITFPCTLTEGAGLGAFANFVRARFTKAGVEVERQEIGASDFIVAVGSNRLGASSTLRGDFIFDFNRGDASGGTLEFNFTDDRGNSLTAPFSF